MTDDDRAEGVWDYEARAREERRRGARETIPRVRPDHAIPPGAACQEAIYSLGFGAGYQYVPCGAPAVRVIWHDCDGRSYYMCDVCANHNIGNRGGREVTV